MANDASKIRFAPNGAIYIAPAPVQGQTGGTTLPVDLGTAGTDPAGYKALGYVDEGGVTLTPQIETQAINAWQSAVPILYNVQSASFSVKATLQETNQTTTELFWGASWEETSTGSGVYKLNLSSVPELKEISIVVDWQEGDIRYRCVVPRAMISDRGAIQLVRTENNKYELTMEAMDYGGQLGYVLTNDALTSPTGSGTSTLAKSSA
ncbi:phage tail tube protein [Streptomyces misionensis]|uniref:phage tail tube protein n=1 Tax=Streptomyces misionensis TaxID=67331 RepID=UPI0036C7FDBC